MGRAMSLEELLIALIGFELSLIVLLAIFAIRGHGRLTRLEEWARLMEKRLNGK
jgi:Tfp pilus assembly protein PilW